MDAVKDATDGPMRVEPNRCLGHRQKMAKSMTLKSLPFGITLLALSACATPTPAPPAPPPSPRPASTPPAPAPSSWTLAPLTPGNWSYRTASNGSAAIFGPDSQGARFLMTCNFSSRTISFTRAGARPGGSLTIRSTNGVKSMAMGSAAGDAQGATASLPGTDPFLDLMVFSRGRIMVEADGAERIIIPAWAELFRVVEDCRK